MVSVAIYVRLSDEDRDKTFKDEESESIQNQKSLLTDYCNKRGWDIYDVYCDEDYSGADRTRPDFNRMINDCENGKIDIVLCKTLSRFSRDMEIIERYLHDKFLEWNVRFISIVDNTDTNDNSNKKSRQINGLVNEWYLEEVSNSTRTTLKHKREKGEFTGSFAPYGYLVDPNDKNHLIIDKEAAAVVKQIFDWYVMGWGYRKIVLELNERHIPNPTAHKKKLNSKYVNKNENKSYSKGLWTNSTIYTIIRNEIYTGTLVQGKTHPVSYKNHKRKKVAKDEWIRVPGTHEAIITPEVWEKTKARLSGRVRSCGITKELSPLAGKLKCAVCEKPMNRNVYYNTDRTRTYYGVQCATYRIGAMNCSNKKTMSGLVLEAAVVEQLNGLIETYCNMDEVDIKTHEETVIAEQTEYLGCLDEQLKDTQRKLDLLYEDKLDGTISKEQYIAYSEKVAADINALKARCSEVEKKIEKLRGSEGALQDKKEVMKKYFPVEKLTHEIVDEFIEAVYIGETDKDKNREVKIVWKI